MDQSIPLPTFARLNCFISFSIWAFNSALLLEGAEAVDFSLRRDGLVKYERCAGIDLEEPSNEKGRKGENIFAQIKRRAHNRRNDNNSCDKCYKEPLPRKPAGQKRQDEDYADASHYGGDESRKDDRAGIDQLVLQSVGALDEPQGEVGILAVFAAVPQLRGRVLEELHQLPER